MKKWIASILSILMLLSCMTMAAAETPVDMLTKIASDMFASETGFDVFVTAGGETFADAALIPEDGALKQLYIELPGMYVYADDKASYATDGEGTVVGVSYDELMKALGLTADGTTQLSLNSEEPLASLTGFFADIYAGIPADVYAMDSAEDGSMTITLDMKKLLPALDTAVANAIQAHASDVNALCAGASVALAGFPKDAEALSEAWASLNLAEADLGFEALYVVITPSIQEDSMAYNVTVLADETQLAAGEMTMGFDGSMALNLEGFGHTAKITMLQENGITVIAVTADDQELFAMAYSMSEDGFTCSVSEGISGTVVTVSVRDTVQASVTMDGTMLALELEDVTENFAHESTLQATVKVITEDGEFPYAFALVYMDAIDGGYQLVVDTTDDSEENETLTITVTDSPELREIPEVTQWLTADDIQAVLSQSLNLVTE